jgi:hypothetical protein
MKLRSCWGYKLLHFSKILDTYEEPEDVIEEVHDEAYWRKKSTWTVDAASELLFSVGELYPLKADIL